MSPTAQRSRHPARRRLGALGIALLLGGCAGAPPSARPGASHLLASVPFIPQDAYQCGPAALAMVLGHHGVPADAETIGRELYLPSVRGTLNLELELYARRRGFRTRAFAGSLVAVRQELLRGRPLIVLQDLGQPPLFSQPHFAVLVGFDDGAGEVVLHSGTTRHLRLGYAAFERTWAVHRYWTLLILPGGA